VSNASTKRLLCVGLILGGCGMNRSAEMETTSVQEQELQPLVGQRLRLSGRVPKGALKDFIVLRSGLNVALDPPLPDELAGRDVTIEGQLLLRHFEYNVEQSRWHPGRSYEAGLVRQYTLVEHRLISVEEPP
jgi:hypothetical protein